MKQKISKYKQTLFALILYVLWVVGFATYSIINEKRDLYQQVDNKLLAAIQIAPLLLDEDLHHKDISTKSFPLDLYQKNTHKLSLYTDHHKIAYIYTLILKDNKLFFTSSSATEKEGQLGSSSTSFLDIYEDADPRVFDVFEHQEKIFIEYTDRWGTFRSIFVPFRAKDGSLYISAADISIDYISKKLQYNLYLAISIALLFILFAYPIYFTAIRKITRLADGLSETVEAQSIEITDKTERLQLAMKVSKQGWFDLNMRTGDMQVSDEILQLLGLTPQTFEFTTQAWKKTIHPSDSETVSSVFKEVIEGKESRETEYRIKHKSGQWLWIHSIGQVTEWNEDKQAFRVIGVHTDISDRKRSEQVLRTLAERGSAKDNSIFQQMVRELAISQNVRYTSISILDETAADHLTTLAIWANNKIIENLSFPLTDMPCGQVIEKGECFFPKDLQSLFPNMPKLKEMGIVSYFGVPLRNSDGKNIGSLSIFDDKPMKEDIHMSDLLGSLAVRISIELDQREADKQLTLFSRVFAAAHEGIIITDAQQIIIDVNPMFTNISGYSRDDAIGKSPRMLSSGKHSTKFFVDMWKSVSDQGFWKGELWNHRKNGELYAELLTVSVILDDEGNIQNYVGLFSDITKHKEQQASLELMAHYDVLTGLPNRSLFVDRYKQAVAHSDRSDTSLAVCFLDLDNFKPVNDNYGHLVGDQLLIEVAQRIKSEIRAEDTVSRLGGDEFVFLLGDITSQKQCEHILKRLHTTIAKPYRIEGHSIIVSASSGVTLYPQDKEDLDTLLRHTDQAMYKSKLAGKNQYQFFDPQKSRHRADKQEQLKEIHHAILQDEMQLYYQPKVNMKTGAIFGVEALIRWIHPEKGLIPPLMFLPIIESSELETILGEWVINTALNQLSEWNKSGLLLEVSVNISSYHLQSASFIDQLKLILSNHPDINSNHLQLEILESSALSDLKAISQIVKQCRNELGMQIALDDFGTGYSSLTHLRNLSADTIKIDQSFVRNVMGSAEDLAIIEGVIGLANAFNREVIAEGVETVEIGLLLLSMGCEQAQGYGIAKPMPAKDVINWAKHYQPEPQWMQYKS